jgi:hypothetical protein
MMLQKCMTILVSSLWLKNCPRDLVSWPQKFVFHQVSSIHRVIAQIVSPSVTTCLWCRSLSSILEPRYMVKNREYLFGKNILYDEFRLSFNF